LLRALAELPSGAPLLSGAMPPSGAIAAARIFVATIRVKTAGHPMTRTIWIYAGKPSGKARRFNPLSRAATRPPQSRSWWVALYRGTTLFAEPAGGLSTNTHSRPNSIPPWGKPGLWPLTRYEGAGRWLVLEDPGRAYPWIESLTGCQGQPIETESLLGASAHWRDGRPLGPSSPARPHPLRTSNRQISCVDVESGGGALAHRLRDCVPVYLANAKRLRHPEMIAGTLAYMAPGNRRDG